MYSNGSWGYEPPNPVNDEAKVDGMIETLRAGGSLPPIVVCGEKAWTGSHRLAAYKAEEIYVEDSMIIELDLDEESKILREMGDDWDSYDDFVDAGISLGILPEDTSY